MSRRGQFATAMLPAVFLAAGGRGDGRCRRLVASPLTPIGLRR